MEPQIVHESEVHRQHVRLKIPITVEIDGTRFTVDDWSMGGFGVDSEMTSRQPGERFPCRLIFPFEDFEVSLRLDAQMVYILADQSRFGCKFLGLSQGQLSLFRYLVDAYLSGEMVSAGDVLAIAGRDNSAEARVQPLSFNPYADEETTGRKVRRILGMSLLGLLGLGLVGVVGLGAYERFLTVEAESAVIQAPVVRVRAPDNGRLQTMPTAEIIEPGTVIGVLETTGESNIRIESPCECVLLDWHFVSGQYVQVGEPLAVLVSAVEPLRVRAQVDFASARGLSEGDPAIITIPGRPEPMAGRVDRVDFRPSLGRLAGDEVAGDRQVARVVVTPEEPFDFDELGVRVEVRFP